MLFNNECYEMIHNFIYTSNLVDMTRFKVKRLEL